MINRVFDSSGPEGKVRGTPQQIIEKYQTLARDAQLADDRVASENFLQHAEHYIRVLGEAQREMNQRREQEEARRREQQAQAEAARAAQQKNREPDETEQPDVAVEIPDVIPAPLDAEGGESGLVETPESKPRGRRRKPSPKNDQAAE